MQKKKILFIYYKLFKPGGVAKVMTNLANELVENGYDVEILIMTSKTETFYSLNKNIKIHTADMFSHWAWGICEFNVKYLKFIPKIQNINSYISHIGVYLLLKNWLLKNHQNYDTIVSCWYKLSTIIGLFNKKIAQKNIAWEHIDHGVGGVIYRDTLRKYYKTLKGIVCINTPSITYYEQFNKTFFIPNIIGEPFDNKPFIRPENKENIISFVGRLEKDKNVSELLEIISETEIPHDWKLQIIGDGIERTKLEKFVKDKNLTNIVHFIGTKTTDEISKLLDKSKIFVLTSLKEGLPTVLIEAMFSSNILISYNCNHGPSDIINENNGFLIPMHDKNLFREKLESVLKNPEKLSDMITTSYKESQKWKKGKILEKWTEIL
jgi:wffI